MLGCGVKQNLQLLFARNEVFIALPIFYGYSPTFLKYALHHSSPRDLLVPFKSRLHRLSSRLCHFTTLKFNPHHLPSEWCCFISCLWNLDNITFLQHLKLVLHHLSFKGMFVQCQSPGGILLTSSRFCQHLFASSKSWWEFLETSRFCWHFLASSKSWWDLLASSKSWQHTLASSKYRCHFFPHLQDFVDISLHLQNLDRDSLHLQCLVGISKILMFGYSAMHSRRLSYVASKN